jgi:hypothetical protein
MGKERKGKEKDFSVKRAAGIFGPIECARAAGPARPANGARCGDDTVGVGPHASEGEGNDVKVETAFCPRWRGTSRRRSRRWFFTDDPVLGGRGGGIAHVGVGGQFGR